MTLNLHGINYKFSISLVQEVFPTKFQPSALNSCRENHINPIQFNTDRHGDISSHKEASLLNIVNC